MTDIVEQLREELADVRADAELLRAEIERLRALLRHYAGYLDDAIAEELIAALEHKP